MIILVAGLGASKNFLSQLIKTTAASVCILNFHTHHPTDACFLVYRPNLSGRKLIVSGKTKSGATSEGIVPGSKRFYDARLLVNAHTHARL